MVCVGTFRVLPELVLSSPAPKQALPASHGQPSDAIASQQDFGCEESRARGRGFRIQMTMIL